MEWDVSMSTEKLPEEIRGHFKKRAKFLHGDLLGNRYKGVLCELPYTTTWDGQKGRITESHNPLWYSNFYWENTPHWIGKRGPREIKKTLDRRCFTKGLGLIADSDDRDFLKYDSLARRAVLDTLLNGVEIKNNRVSSLIEMVSFAMEVEAVNEVCRFFGEDEVDTYRDELNRFREEYGETGDAMFFAQYEE